MPEKVEELLIPLDTNDLYSVKILFQEMYDSGKYNDLTFVVARKEIYANETICKMRSSVLKAKIENPERIPNGRILLDDQSLEDFEQFLKFLQTDDCEITTQNFIGLFLLGKKYDVQPLCKKCVIFFGICLNKENVQTFLLTTVNVPEFAEFFEKCFTVVPTLIDFMNFYHVDADGSVSSVFPPSFIQKILKFDRPVEAEDALFRKVYDWVEICRLRDLIDDTVAIKETMKDLIPFIRFGNLKKYTLATIVRSNKLLSTEELLSHFIRISINEPMYTVKKIAMNEEDKYDIN